MGHPWHQTYRDSLVLPESPLPCHLVPLPLFIPVPAAGIGGKQVLCSQAANSKQPFPGDSWPAGSPPASASACRLGPALLLQPATLEQQDVGNRRSPGSGAMPGGSPECNG